MPYSPTVTDRTGEFLMRGITGAADSIAQGIQTYRKNKEESKGFDTYLESLAKQYAADPKFVDTFGEQIAKAPAMSLSQKRNLVGSLALYEQKGRQSQEMALKQADDTRADQFLKLQQDQFSAGQQQRDAQGRLSQNLARYAAAPADLGSQFANGTAGLDAPGGLTLDRYLAAAGEAGAPPDPRVLEQFIQNGQRQDRPQWGGPSITMLTNPATGAQVPVFMGGPNQASLMPDDELSPQGKQRAIDQLQARRVQLAVALKDADVMEAGPRGRLESMLNELDGRLADLTGTAAKPSAGAAGGETPEQIRDLMRSGKLSRDEAVKKLRALGFK